MRSHSTPFLDHEEISGHPNHASHGFWDRLAAWLPRIQSRGSTPPPVQSNYLTLIPLSDERLKPRHDKALITAAIIFAGLLATAVFVTVPRGVAVGAVKVISSEMLFNTTSLTYRIIVRADLPIYNPNMLPVKLSGQLNVSFYDQQAGWAQVQATTIDRRAAPQVIAAYIDASNVPRRYMQPLHDQCWSFPHKLVFFLYGTLTAEHATGSYDIPPIDTYFMLDCNGSRKAAEAHERRLQQAGVTALEL